MTEIMNLQKKKREDKKSTIKKSSIEEFKEICTDLGLTHGTDKYVDCVLKLKSDEEKMIKITIRNRTRKHSKKCNF